MRKIKVFNNYAGVGGNRSLWEDVEVTACELDPEKAAVYQDLHPNDKVIIADGHEYMRQHYQEFDFIWTSPVCITHSQMRQNLAVRFRGTLPEYPDMNLYQEIIFLQYNFNGLWVVENVEPYYKPLIPPTAVIQRHLFWANFHISDVKFPKDNLRAAQIPELQQHTGINLSKYKLSNKRQILRNCVFPPLGLHVLQQARLTKRAADLWGSVPSNRLVHQPELIPLSAGSLNPPTSR